MSKKYRARSRGKDDLIRISSRNQVTRKKRMKQFSPFVERKKKKGKFKSNRVNVSPKGRKKPGIRNLYNGISPIVERKLSATALLVEDSDDESDRKNIITVLDSFNFDSEEDEPTSYMTDFYTHRKTVERLESRIRELTRENLSEKERNVYLEQYRNSFEEMQKELQLLKYKESQLENKRLLLQEKYEKEVEDNRLRTNENQLLKNEKDWVIESFEQRIVKEKDEVGRGLEERHESILQNVREKYKHIIEVQRLEIQTIRQKLEEQDKKMQDNHNEITKLKKTKVYNDSISQTLKELELTIESQRNSLRKYKSEYERLKFEKSNLVHQTIEEEEEKRNLEELTLSTSGEQQQPQMSGKRVVVDSSLIRSIVRENRTLRNLTNSLRLSERTKEELHELEVRKLRKEVSEMEIDCEMKIEDCQKKYARVSSKLQSQLFDKQKKVSSQSLEIMDLNSKIRKHEAELTTLREKGKAALKREMEMMEKLDELEGSKSKLADLLIRIEERERVLHEKMASFEEEKRVVLEFQNESRKQCELLIDSERTKMEDEKLLLKSEFGRKQKELEKKVNSQEHENVDLIQMKDIELLTFRKTQLVAKERESLDEMKRKMSYHLMEEYQRKLKTWVELERAKNRQREVVLDKKFLELKEKQRKFDEMESEIQKRVRETRENERASEDTLREVRESTKDVITQKREIDDLRTKLGQLESKKKEMEIVLEEYRSSMEKKSQEIMDLRTRVHEEERKGFKVEGELKDEVIELKRREIEIIKSKERELEETLRKERKKVDEMKKKEQEEREIELQKLQKRKDGEIGRMKTEQHKKVLELVSLIKKLEQASKEMQKEGETLSSEIGDLKKMIGLKDSEIESLKIDMKKKEEMVSEKEKIILENEKKVKDLEEKIKKKEEEEEEEESEEETETEEEESESEDDDESD